MTPESYEKLHTLIHEYAELERSLKDFLKNAEVNENDRNLINSGVLSLSYGLSKVWEKAND